MTVDTYRKDALYPRITRAVAALLARGKVVAPVDVLVCMDILAPEHLDAWRRGRVPYLEKVIRINLTRLSRLLRILRFHAHDLNLTPSWTAYMRWGKGPKQHLRFTKTGDPRLERAYATHLVWPGKGPFHLPRPKVRREESEPGRHSDGGADAQEGPCPSATPPAYPDNTLAVGQMPLERARGTSIDEKVLWRSQASAYRFGSTNAAVT